ncbi:hypothetical protein BKH46_06935 [Helicobacter sp. 12S02634-8]|uniref:glycosyltransferase n=1 Tax=Helicobacter sp. 12S02634-8 TaxID=1476199 RepID=UPI000BA7BBE3|nr:glycosyltransferase [Helicobacter sp. 12S02634-8]PAF46694.1 hypothetical protein BKH46_06935 [Helicobacter sp. 12S02634-8]
MKILHLVTQDSGGAGRAALRLHLALQKLADTDKHARTENTKPTEPIESLMLVQNKSSDLTSIIRVAKTKTQKLFEKLRPALCALPLSLYPKRHQDIFSVDFIHNRHLIKTINAHKPDIVHLHWINGGFLSVKDLCKIQAPLIWSLHDANPYTGGCHYVAPSCIGVENQCGKCPLLNSNFPFDLSYWNFAMKQKAYKKLNLTINGLSSWIAQCAKESALFKDKHIINLPNPIDTTLYAPLDKHTARTLLRLDNPKKIIAFGAIQATSIKRKGYTELKEALKLLKNKQSLKLLVFGSSGNEMGVCENIEGIETHYLGHLYDDLSLKLVYNAADVVVIPSLAESFGQVASESLACSTPVVCFNIGGLKDIVEHKKTGYLATPFDPCELAQGIEWILDLSPQDYQALAQNSRQKVLTSFEAKKVSLQYLESYKEIIAIGGGASEKLATHLISTQKIIAFGAIQATSIKRKGYAELKEALKLLKNKQSLKLLVFGASANEMGVCENIEGIETHYLGHLYDDLSLKLVYNAADVVVIPSLAENLSNVIVESLSCGTPVVGFDIGGNHDIIEHKKTGYLAQESDCTDLCKGIEWVLNLSPKDYQALAQNSRQKALLQFEALLVAQKYLKAYQAIMDGGGGR